MTTTPQLAPDDVVARPLRKDAARNRELLIVAAHTVFAARGLDATLDDVAREAGVGVGTAYRHFANKYELAGAILDQVMDQVVGLAEGALSADDPWDGLVGFLEKVLELQSADRGLREVLTGAYDSARMKQKQERITGPVTRLIERAQAAGAVRADVAVTDFGFVMIMLCGVADISADTRPDIWRRYLPLLLLGLRPGGPDLPVAALTDEQFQAATAAHHERPRTAF